MMDYGPSDIGDHIVKKTNSGIAPKKKTIIKFNNILLLFLCFLLIGVNSYDTAVVKVASLRRLMI